MQDYCREIQDVVVDFNWRDGLRVLASDVPCIIVDPCAALVAVVGELCGDGGGGAVAADEGGDVAVAVVGEVLPVLVLKRVALVLGRGDQPVQAVVSEDIGPLVLSVCAFLRY